MGNQTVMSGEPSQLPIIFFNISEQLIVHISCSFSFSELGIGHGDLIDQSGFIQAVMAPPEILRVKRRTGHSDGLQLHLQFFTRIVWPIRPAQNCSLGEQELLDISVVLPGGPL